DERRVVYVGRIRRTMTHDELRERFSQFGEVECVSLHFRDGGDHYGFVTFYNTENAFAAIDNGGKLRNPDELPFDLCFGGRRQFCNSDYSDLEPCHFRLNIAKAPAGQEATTLCITLRTCPHLAGTRDTSSVGWWKKWGLNTYLYAPKDDYKHRIPDSFSRKKQIVIFVEFIYAISPGLDITFSNPKEVASLKRKLDQVRQFGCRSFSLLFDDIEREMCPADKEAFSSFAHAQVAITNEVYQHLGDAKTFLFCPTGQKLMQNTTWKMVMFKSHVFITCF
ncbi:hypothetical protein XENOCAPTIV_016435, partial [Xenoophorus captivus]